MPELPVKISIVTATTEIIDDLVLLFDKYRQFYKQESDLVKARFFLEDRLNNNESMIFMAYQNNKAIGFTQLYPSFSSVSLRQLWILNDLYVIQEMRGNRVGEVLINKAIEYSSHRGAKGLLISTSIENQTAQKLYERVGFRKDIEFLHYFLPTY